MSRVFVIDRSPRYDVSPAREHGDVVFMSPRAPDPFKPDECLSAFHTQLDELGFQPSTDMLCMSGNMLHVAYALSALVARHSVGITVLAFDSRTGGKYVRRVVDANWRG